MRVNQYWLLAFACVGCASYPQPTENLANSVGATRGAEQAGAREVPQAALHVRLADEQNERAKQLMEDGENERADRMTRRAQSDAELALELAREKRANQQAQMAQAQTETTQPAP